MNTYWVLKNKGGDRMKFYSVVKKGWVNIPAAKTRKVKKKGRNFLVGKYKYKGKEYEAWKIVKG